ncbi:MAG: hypothetical protein AAF481_01215 [Acidobacteriota bacterium]
MKLGDVLRKERTKKGIESGAAAGALEVSDEEYSRLEAGDTDAETAGPLLAQIAIALETPVSRLIAPSGRSEDAKAGQFGQLVQEHRERREKSPDEMAEALGIELGDYQQIESGESNLETWAPIFLRFAELIEQPVFNIFYPCGLPFQELDDYP